MSNFDVLLYTPAIPLILATLREAPEGRDETALDVGPAEKKHVAKALQALLERGLVIRHQGRLRLTEEPENLRKVHHLLEFYKGVQQKVRHRLTFRGILNATQYRCLVHLNTFMEMMTQEGFNRAEVDEMLAEEKSGGRVEHLTIMYRLRQGLKHKYFPFIPFYYYPHFIVMNSENIGRFKSRLEGAGIVSVEEDYLLGSYPKEMANQAREFISMQKVHIKERVKNEAFDIWWYYRF